MRSGAAKLTSATSPSLILSTAVLHGNRWLERVHLAMPRRCRCPGCIQARRLAFGLGWCIGREPEDAVDGRPCRFKSSVRLPIGNTEDAQHPRRESLEVLTVVSRDDTSRIVANQVPEF